MDFNKGLNQHLLQLLLASSIISFASSTETSCYDKLETIRFGWSIENLLQRPEKLDQTLDSPLFPVANNSETKWYLKLYPKGRSGSANDISLFVCVEKFSRQMELALYKLNVLENDGRKVFTSFVSKPTYFPDVKTKLPCFGRNQFLSMNKLSQYLQNNGSLDVSVELERLRKLPECLQENEKDIGRGIIPLNKPPEVLDGYCETRTFVNQDIMYMWNGVVHNATNIGNEITIISPSFRNIEDEMWQLELKIQKSDNVALYLTKYGGNDITVNYYFDILPQNTNRDVITLFASGRNFTVKSFSWGFNDAINYSNFIRNYVTSKGEFKISVRILVVEAVNMCTEDSNRLFKRDRHDLPIALNLSPPNDLSTPPVLKEVVSELREVLQLGKENNEQLQIQIQQFQQQHFHFQQQLTRFEQQQKELEKQLSRIKHSSNTQMMTVRPPIPFPIASSSHTQDQTDLTVVIDQLKELLSLEKKNNEKLHQQITLFQGQHLQFQQQISNFQWQQQQLEQQIKQIPKEDQQEPPTGQVVDQHQLQETSTDSDKACFKLPKEWKDTLPSTGENLWILWTNVPQVRGSVLQPIGDMLITPTRTISLVDALGTEEAYNVIKPDNMTSSILGLANARKLESLKGICQSILIQTITPENILTLLVVADKTDATELLNKALTYVFENRAKIEQSGLTHVLNSYPHLQLQYKIKEQEMCEKQMQEDCFPELLN